jgi:hypothetical protein
MQVVSHQPHKRGVLTSSKQLSLKESKKKPIADHDSQRQPRREELSIAAAIILAAFCRYTPYL